MEKEHSIMALHGLWYAILIFGLNSAQFLAISDRLIFVFLLFSIVESALPKRGYLLNSFFALLIIQNTNYPGKLYSLQWIKWLAQDIIREFSTAGSLGYYMPITAMCLNLTVIIFMQAIFTRVWRKGEKWVSTIFFFLGTALLAIAYVEQPKGNILYVLLFVLLGLLIRAVDLRGSVKDFAFGPLLRNSLPWVLVLILFAFILPGYDSFDVGDWFREEILYRQGLTGKNKVGYNAYDGDLGRHIAGDGTPVMRVRSAVPLYLRGETKSLYTGRGWLTGTRYDTSSLIRVDSLHFSQGYETVINVQMLSPSKILFLPRYAKSVILAKGYQILYPMDIDMTFYPYEYYVYKANLRTGDEYKIIAYIPADDPELLRQLSNENADVAYLSLENVTIKVQNLAKTVAAGADNGYDKAMSIVNYLRQGKWEYSMDTSPPPIGADFAEHFLFDSSSGYCVHFSTAFVLMARSVGLPARWVKGYNYGTQEDKDSYIISNENAHTWGEIWFDDYGWVPFEATPDDPSAHGNRTNGYRELIEREGRWGWNTYEYAGAEAENAEAGKQRTWLIYVSLAIALILMVMAVESFWYYRARTIEVHYTSWQARLKLFGWQRHSWETPREHLNRVNWLPDSSKLAAFISRFEEASYGGNKGLKGKGRELGKAYSYLWLLIYGLKKRFR